MNTWAERYEISCNCQAFDYDPCEDPGTQCYCEMNGGTWSGGHCYYPNCPLLIRLDNNSPNYELTSADDGVEFDMAGSGHYERLAWTAPGAQVAFVVMDRNGNGSIDNGTELFGNATLRGDGTTFDDGFEALAALDANHDGRLDSRDPEFQEVSLWIDANHNGLSDLHEVSSLVANHVDAIFTSHWRVRRVDHYGNRYKLEGDALIIHGDSPRRRRLFDVVFVH